MQDIRRFHQGFYESHNKICQDFYILRYVTVESPKRKRPRPGDKRKIKGVTIRYYIPSLQQGKRQVIQVCQTAFTSVLNVSKARIHRLSKEQLNTGLSPQERRGGDRHSKKYEMKTQSVKKFIESLTPIESHYSRGKTKRYYLPSEINCRYLWREHNKSVDGNLRVKYNFFLNIFSNFYNISFKTPSSDKCSKCIELNEKVKRARGTGDTKLKDNVLGMLGVHKARAKAFFKLLKESETHQITFSFDCQKNLILPKLPDQTAYFSRQFYLYNFTMCQGTSKSPQTKHNTFIYSWSELDGLKGSNEIVSCVYDRLRNTQFPDNIKTIRLFADGCGGQNKNQVMIGMLSIWLKNEAPKHVKNIVLIFPIPGHSFMPPDRIFGRIEKVTRKRETIITPDEYFDIFENFGTVIKPKSFFDWKKLVTSIFKPPGFWHFKFSRTKRFLIIRRNSAVTIQGEPSYYTDIGEPKSVCKRGKAIPTLIEAEVLHLGIPPKPAKVLDVEKLLKKHYGEDWKSIPELKFYDSIIQVRKDDVMELNVENEDEPMSDVDVI